MMDAIQIRADLRRGSGRDLNARRAVAGLALFSNTVLGAVALFQLGILKDLPLPGVAAVNGSVEAYSAGVPDALLGMASYAVTAALAATGPENRVVQQPWLPLALAGKAALDVGVAFGLTAKSWRSFRRFSCLSLLVAGATVAALPFAFSEARRAAGNRQPR